MSNDCHAFSTDGKCHPLGQSGGGGGGGTLPPTGRIQITGSVGHKGVNHYPDVQTIQTALNDVPSGQGGPSPPLVADGISGSRTEKAIQSFQLKHFGWKGADGRVDPGQQTLAKLNELTGSSAPVSHSHSVGPGFGGGILPPPLDLPPRENRILRARHLLGEARRYIRSAQKNLWSAISVVDKPNDSGIISPFNRDQLMRLVNRHFDIDKYPAPMRRGILQNQLLRTFNTMARVFERPGGLWGPYAFDVDPLFDKSIAYAYRAGFFRPGQSRFENAKIGGKSVRIRIRMDAIYFCDKFDRTPDEKAVNAIVHELAHFCGHPYHIRDNAYGWWDHPRMQALHPDRKLLNGMNYNNFAWNTVHSRKPQGYNY